MPAPERRTRADLAAAALIVVVLTGAAAAVWWSSDARDSTLRTAETPLPSSVPAAGRMPAAVREAWRAPSAATPAPVVLGGTVVTADTRTVRGRQLAGGEPRWRYQRGRELCTVAAAFERVLTAYRGDDSCSEITALDPATGSRGPQRNSPLASSVRLVASDSHVLAVGRDYLEVWRSDLVRTLQYGNVPTPVKPDAQPRPGCRYPSVLLADDRVGVIERCPDESADRLSVLRADPDEADEPETVYSTTLPGSGARMIGLSGDRAAVALPNPPRLEVRASGGRVLAEQPLPRAAGGVRAGPVGRVAPVSSTPDGSAWFTGSATVGLDEDFDPRWTRPASLGPGTAVAGRLLVPIRGGLAVLDPRTGRQRDVLPLDRGGYRGPVRLEAAGGMLFEQRGRTLVALQASAQ